MNSARGKSRTAKNKLEGLCRKLFKRFGPQHWWPGETPFEVVIGAILTQNTNWNNVSKAIDNLKEAGVLSPRGLYSLPNAKLASLIRPSGYYNVKAGRLKSFLKFLFRRYGGSLEKMFSSGIGSLRQELLNVNGVGPETVDSILLYAGGLPVFVVDAYTRRMLERHSFISEEASYAQVQELFMKNIKKDVKLYNEYHALIVRLGKEICKKSNPRCNICPLSPDFSPSGRAGQEKSWSK